MLHTPSDTHSAGPATAERIQALPLWPGDIDIALSAVPELDTPSRSSSEQAVIAVVQKVSIRCAAWARCCFFGSAIAWLHRWECPVDSCSRALSVSTCIVSRSAKTQSARDLSMQYEGSALQTEALPMKRAHRQAAPGRRAGFRGGRRCLLAVSQRRCVLRSPSPWRYEPETD